MESFQGCKICGCWDLKQVFRVNRIRYALGSWADRRRALRRRRETSVEGPSLCFSLLSFSSSAVYARTAPSFSKRIVPPATRSPLIRRHRAQTF